MGYLQPAILLAVAAAAVQFVAPYITRSYILFTPPANAVYARFDSLIANAVADGQCQKHHPELLKGCEDMHFDAGIMYAACVSDFQMRRKWIPGLGQRYLEQERSQNGGQVGQSGLMIDKMVKWNVETDEAVELELRGFPNNVDFALHGFDINVLSPSNITFYIINHRPFGSVVEKFWHTPGEDHLNFIKTIHIPFSSAGGAPTPNDIFAIPESDHKSGFFVTNDHRFKEGILRKVEDVARLPLGHISYYDDEGSWKIVAKNIIQANGITGTKKMASAENSHPPPSNNLYVSSCGGGFIRVFSRNYGSSEIYPVQDIVLDSLPDNPSLSYPSQSKFLIAGFPEPAILHDYVVKPAGEGPERSPVAIYSFRTNQIGSSFYGEGYTGEVPVETVFADRKGLLGNATSISLLVEGEEGLKGDLYMSGLMTDGIMRCRKFM
ncbi:hypothetical protein L211DRAFT_302983 [Terfezia boudieri ATCC MYA-4762]|uniref:Calcium-dependent phosphotriesterase n=1 Tax=Terfezia boudieri ATCC MYA-4762 TaxID=1051890 RepID=A0A3N4LMR4_9PEZI|nr:hypothetical protein L211DRAFT_302983 [Terfezia boudieri ATCC MYA-4762]